MFEKVPTAPADPIFGLTAAFLQDPNPHKINLGVGVYRDERGRTPILEVVKEAERRLWQQQESKTYLPIEGDPVFSRSVERLVFGKTRQKLVEGGLVTIQAPGGTGALRLAMELVRDQNPAATVWLPEPTWVNHPQLAAAVGLETRIYPYLDANRHRLDLQKLLVTLTALAPGDLVVLHGCCHNPSGVDPADEQWQQIADLLRDRRALPLVDFAYLGFGQGLEADRRGVLTLATTVPELLVCTSFSKNFGLYSERVGALTVAAPSTAAAAAVLSQLRKIARVSYSNPPAHGAAMVSMILESGEMQDQWRQEVETMRRRIVEMRRLFVAGLDARRVLLAADGNEFLTAQRGMFSFTGLQKTQVERLRLEHSVYMVDSGRVNFAAMTKATMDYLCDAVAAVR